MGDSLGMRRIAAWFIDWLIISVYPAGLIPLGLVLVERDVQLSAAGWNAVSFALLIVPVAVWLTAWERGPWAATPGKRWLRLRVQAEAGGPTGWTRALVRNGLKIAVPWELGHTAAFIFAEPSVAGATLAVGVACGIVAGLLAFGYALSLFVGTGETPYDRVSGGRVRLRRPAG